MPRIPKSAVTVGITPVSAQPIRETLETGRAITGFAESLTQFASQLEEAQRKEELIEKSAGMEAALADLQFDIQTNPELNTVIAADQAFQEGAEKIYAEFGESESRVVGLALDKQFMRSSLQAGVAVRGSAYKRQADASIANLDTAAEDFKRAYAAAPDDEKRAEIRDLHARNVNLSEFITEEAKGNLIRAFETETDTGFVRGLIDAGASAVDSDSAKELFDEAEDMLSDPAELLGLDELARQQMLRTLSVARDKAERDRASDLKKLEDTKTHKMLRRFYDPEDPDGVPTVMDVLDAGFSSRAVTEHFIKMVEDHAAGVDVNKINPNVYNNLYARIHDPNHSDPITDMNQILPFVGNGISPEKAESFRADIEDLQSDTAAIDDALFTDFLDMAEAQINKSTMFGKDAVGERKYYEFRFAVQELYNEGIKAGKDPRDLLNPSHPDYVGRIIDSYRRTDLQVMKDMSAEMQRLEAASGVEPRGENESMEAWLQRTAP